MSYVIKAVLSNPSIPENGAATISFPLSSTEYDHSICKVLKPMMIGSAVAQDCMAEEIDSSYEVLDCLKGQVVNVDELNYLAKRLDSFCNNEYSSFQAACHVLGLKDIKDLINLTFCCQETTVICDFSKLEEAGKQHYLTIHGGSALAEELDKVDGKALAQQLIQSGEGKPTPYGLFFRNGMRLEEKYNGHGFPPYLWDSAQAEVVLTKPDGTTAYVFLPITELALERFQQRESIRDLTECQRTLRLFQSCGERIEMQGDMAEFRKWNELCKDLNAMYSVLQRKFHAAVEVTGAKDLSQLQLLASSLEDFKLIPGVKDAESYGRHMIQESDQYSYDAGLECYYNYEAFGEFLMLHETGRITSQGYLKCEEDSAFLDFFIQSAPEGIIAEINDQRKIPVTITPMGQPEKRESLVLPCPADHVTHTLQKLGVASLRECGISVDTDRICPAVLSVFEDEFDFAEHFETFNLLARCYQSFDNDTIDRFHVVFDCVQPQTPEEILYLAQGIAEFVVVPGISTAEEYGYHLAEKSDFLVPDLPEHKNYKEYGTMRIQAEHGLFGDKGYVAYKGTTPQITAMLARFTVPQHESVAEMGEKSMTMGEM